MTTVIKEESVKKKKFREAPHPFVILFTVVIIMAALTYLIPAGQYDRVEDADGRTIVVDGSYQTIDSSPAGFLDIFNAIHKGMFKLLQLFSLFLWWLAHSIYLESPRQLKVHLVPCLLK